MELEHMIENMKKALKRDKLVIFVGAGVSKNSGIPTWGQNVTGLFWNRNKNAETIFCTDMKNAV